MSRVKLSLINPLARPSYYSNKKYLGKVVKDVGKPGLDKEKEYRDILKAILRDYRRGKIDASTARGRLLLLYRLTFPSRNVKARNIPKEKRIKLREAIKKAMEKIGN